jgi:hypothetical protein
MVRLLLALSRLPKYAPKVQANDGSTTRSPTGENQLKVEIGTK